MYFLPRNNKFYSFVVHIRPLYRYLLTALVLSAVFYAWFFGIYKNIDNAIQQYQASLARSQTQQEACTNARKACKQLEPQVAQLQTAIGKHAQLGHTATERLQASMMTVFDCAQRAGLEFNACRIEKENDNGWYTTHLMSMEFVGSLSNALHFFEALQKANLILAYERVELHCTQANIFTINCWLELSAVK